MMLCLIVSPLGCAELLRLDAFEGADPTTGTGGNAGEGGGTAGNTNTGGNAGGGNTGTGGNAGEGGQGGMGGESCTDVWTYDQVAEELGKSCTAIFSSTNCDGATEAPRSATIAAVVDQVSEKLQGYTDPVSASFADVSLTSPAEKALWLELIQPDNNFFPDDPSEKCWVEDLVADMNALPTIYAIVIENTPDDTVGSGGGAVATTKYDVYGTSQANHLTQLVRLVSNLTADFTVPQSTTALEAVIFRCEVPTGGSFTPHNLPLTAGAADFNTLDCYNQAGGPMEVQLQVDPDINGAGQKARIGIDPSTLVVRRGPGGTQADNPTITVN